MLDDGRLVSVRVGFVVVRSCGSCGDCSVPVSRLPQLVYETKKDLAQSKLASTIVGHVGDGKRFQSCLISCSETHCECGTGNFHAFILFKKDSELQAVSDAVHRLVHRAIALDGTCEPPFGVCVLIPR